MEKARILIVEDEAIIAMEIESQLQSLGYEITSIVDTGEKAIKKAKEDKPDIILMDIRIKGEMDGIDTAEVIRNRFGIPVIFSTAYLDEERIERAKITMPFGYVLKPIQERDLKVTLEMALYVAKVDAERKRSEDVLRQSEEKYRSVVEGISDGFFILDHSLKVTYFNNASENLLGRKREEVLTRPLFDSFPEAKNSIFEEKYSYAVKHKEYVKFETFFGVEPYINWYDVRVYPFETGIFVFFLITTERKKTEDALQKAHDELEQQVEQRTRELVKVNEELRLQSEIMTNMAEGVYLIGADNGIIVYTNPKFEQMFGYGPKEMIGKHVSIVNAPTEKKPEDTAEEIMEILNKTGIWQGDVDNIKKDGTMFQCHANVSVFDHKKYGKVLVSVHTEFIERKQAEE